MRAHLGGSRRRSFKPAFDLLETRTLPSGLFTVSGLPAPLLDAALAPADANPSGPAVVVSTQRLRVSPGGDPATFTLALNTQPTADVHVTLAQFNLALLAGALPGLGGDLPSAPVGGTTQLTITPDHLTFTKDNWNKPQTVSVSAPATPVPAASSPSCGQLVWVFGTTTSSDPSYDALAVAPVTVAVVPQAQTNPGGVTVSQDHLVVTQGGDPVTYTVALTSKPTADVTLTITQVSPETEPPIPLPGGSATAPTPVGGNGPLTVTPTTLTFTSDNWDKPQTVTVSAPAPTGTGTGTTAAFPGIDSNFVLLFQQLTSQDPRYNGLEVPPVSVTIKHHEGTGNIVLSTDHLNLTAGGAAATYTVALASKPTADVTITVSQANPELPPVEPGAGARPVSGNPLAEVPLTIAPTTLKFTPDDWDKPQTVTVTPPASAPRDQFDFLVHTASSTDPNYTDVELPSVGVFLEVAQAQRAALVFSQHELDVTAGGSASYTVALAVKPTANVTVTISESHAILDPPGLPPVPIKPVGAVGANALVATMPPGPGDDTVALTITPTTLTFTPDNWDKPQTVTVSAPANAGGVEAEGTFLYHAVQSDDPNYNGLFSPPVVVHVQESGTTSGAGLVFSQDELKVVPGGAAATYTIALATKPTAAVTVTIAVGSPVVGPLGAARASDGELPPMPPVPIGGTTPLTITPMTLTFTPDNWDKAQTVSVSAPANTTGSAVEFFGIEWLVHTVKSDDPNYSGLQVPPVTVAVVGGEDHALPVPVALPPAPASDMVPPPVVVTPNMPAKPPGTGAGTKPSAGHGSTQVAAAHHVAGKGHNGHHGHHARKAQPSGPGGSSLY
jgi:hypothetical protein